MVGLETQVTASIHCIHCIPPPRPPPAPPTSSQSNLLSSICSTHTAELSSWFFLAFYLVIYLFSLLDQLLYLHVFTGRKDTKQMFKGQLHAPPPPASRIDNKGPPGLHRLLAERKRKAPSVLMIQPMGRPDEVVS